VRHGLDPQEQQSKDGVRPGDARWGLQPPGQDGTLGVDPEITPIRTAPGAYQAFYVALRRALDGEGPLPVDPWDAVVVLDVLEAARRAADERASVRMPP